MADYNYINPLLGEIWVDNSNLVGTVYVESPILAEAHFSGNSLTQIDFSNSTGSVNGCNIVIENNVTGVPHPEINLPAGCTSLSLSGSIGLGYWVNLVGQTNLTYLDFSYTELELANQKTILQYYTNNPQYYGSSNPATIDFSGCAFADPVLKSLAEDLIADGFSITLNEQLLILTQKKQGISLSGNQKMLAESALSQKKQTIDVVVNCSMLASSALIQKKQVIAIGGAGVYVATLGLLQKKQDITIASRNRMIATVIPSQKKQAIAIGAEGEMKSSLHLVQKKQTAHVAAVEKENLVTLHLTQKKQDIFVVGTSVDNFDIVGSIVQKKQEFEVAGYVISNIATIAIAQKKQTTALAGTSVNNSMFQKKQAIEILAVAKDNVLGSIALSQRKQSLAILGTQYRPFRTITFYPNKGTGASFTQNLKENESANLVINTYVRFNYPFLGWSLTVDGPVAYLDQAFFTMGSEDVSLYAKWEAIPVLENDYVWLEPAIEFETLPSGTDIEAILTDSQAIAETNSAIVRVAPDYVRPVSEDQDEIRNLHSTMQNEFYRALFKALRDERYNLYDRAYDFMKLTDLTPSGDNDVFMRKVENLNKLLNASLPTFFFECTTAEDPTKNLLDYTNQWIRLLLATEYLARRFAGSREGYRLAFTRIRRAGSIYLQSSYGVKGETAFLNPLYGHFFRMIDVDQLALNTEQQGTTWPNVPTFIEGAEEYLSNLNPLKFDTLRQFDEGYDPAHPTQSAFIKWDNVSSLSPIDKGLMLEFTLDRLLLHENSANAPECLIDDPWFQCLTLLLAGVKKASDTVRIGSQISLTAVKSGKMSEYATDDPYEDERDIYTHPNIHARFQLFRRRYLENGIISRIEIGQGVLDPNATEFWAKASDNPVGKEVYAPTSLEKPLFSTVVGSEEQRAHGGYTYVFPSIRKLDINGNELVVEHLTIPAAGTNYVVADADRIVIDLPHKNLAYGTCSFDIEFILDVNGVEEIRVFRLTEDFNPKMQAYSTRTTLWKRIGDKLVPPDPFKLIDYISDNTYSNDNDYFPSYTDDLVILGTRQTYPLPGPGQTFSAGQIMYEEGQLILYTKLSKDGELQSSAAIVDISATVTCHYSVNSYRVKNSALDSKNNLIGVSEVGVFNATGDLIAYGTFPKIIYNPNVYHLSLNLALQNVERTDDSLIVQKRQSMAIVGTQA